MIHTGWNIEIENVQATEKEGGKYTHIRTPNRKDYESNGKPSSVTKGVIGPYTACIIHNIIQTAETCNHTSDAGGNVFVPCNVNTGSIGCIRSFTDSPKVQSHPGMI